MLTVHRTTVLADVISQFAQIKALNDPAVEMGFTVIDNRGNIELGAGIGVCRDVITMFWAGFFNSLTVGTKVRIPTIRHGYEAKEWDAIALFLLKGLMQCGYFPLALSPVYVKLVLYGEKFITNDELLNELLRFVATSGKFLMRITCDRFSRSSHTRRLYRDPTILPRDGVAFCDLYEKTFLKIWTTYMKSWSQQQRKS